MPRVARKAGVQKAFLRPLDILPPPDLITGDFNAMVPKGREVTVLQETLGGKQGSPGGISHHDVRHHQREPCLVGTCRPSGAQTGNSQVIAHDGDRPAHFVRRQATVQELVAAVPRGTEIALTKEELEFRQVELTEVARASGAATVRKKKQHAEFSKGKADMDEPVTPNGPAVSAPSKHNLLLLSSSRKTTLATSLRSAPKLRQGMLEGVPFTEEQRRAIISFVQGGSSRKVSDPISGAAVGVLETTKDTFEILAAHLADSDAEPTLLLAAIAQTKATAAEARAATEAATKAASAAAETATKAASATE